MLFDLPIDNGCIFYLNDQDEPIYLLEYSTPTDFCLIVVNSDKHTGLYTNIINYDFSVCLPMADKYNLRKWPGYKIKTHFLSDFLHEVK